MTKKMHNKSQSAADDRLRREQQYNYLKSFLPPMPPEKYEEECRRLAKLCGL